MIGFKYPVTIGTFTNADSNIPGVELIPIRRAARASTLATFAFTGESPARRSRDSVYKLKAGRIANSNTPQHQSGTSVVNQGTTISFIRTRQEAATGGAATGGAATGDAAGPATIGEAVLGAANEAVLSTLIFG